MENNPFYDPSLKKRHFSSKVFKYLAGLSTLLTLIFLVFFLADMIYKGKSAFFQTYIKVEVSYTEKSVNSPRKAIDKNLRKYVSRAWIRNIPNKVKENPALLGTKATVWALADDQVDQYIKGRYTKLKEKQQKFIDSLVNMGKVEKQFNTVFFTNGDSKSPEYSGILSAAVGSIMVIIVTILVSLPIGVMTAIYLEEFSKDNKFTQIIEININNLAAVPSILFGLLGLAIFINLFGIPRSSAVAGGLTLGIMTLPVIIVSSRAALRSIPATIRQAGFGLGLTKIQIVKDHVLPLAFPGILTGAIIGIARAMGETAPLLIIGMIAFIPEAPGGFLDAATVMPAQIFTWAGMPETAYIERTAAGILTLLAILLSLNALAIFLRNRYEIKW